MNAWACLCKCSPRHVPSHYEVCSSCKQFSLDSCYGPSSVLLKFLSSVRVFSVCMSSHGIAGSYGSYMFSFFFFSFLKHAILFLFFLGTHVRIKDFKIKKINK